MCEQAISNILILGKNTTLSEASGPYKISSRGCEVLSEDGINFCSEPDRKTSSAENAIISLVIGPIVWLLH